MSGSEHAVIELSELLIMSKNHQRSFHNSYQISHQVLMTDPAFRSMKCFQSQVFREIATRKDLI